MNYCIRTTNVGKEYLVGKEKRKALKEISLDFKKGEIIVILGPSGSGKTTLLNVLSGIDKVTEGTIYYEEKNISTFSERQMTKFRKKYISIIFQKYNLLENLNVYQNILMGKGKEKGKSEINEIMDLLELKDKRRYQIKQLSGGEQQRVAIARAILKKPKVLFCDEPTGSLDERMGKKILKYLVMINEKENITIIIVTHNPGIALIGDKIILMKEGTIYSEKTTKIRMNPEIIPWG